MNDWIEGSDAKSATVSIWTPWGEQKVLRSTLRTTSLWRKAARVPVGGEASAVSDAGGAAGN